ncbi:Predicted pyrophosphatase or phosphodiesterase, AlkP superfamily [Kytococcus aerolatus]|uniref:Predicted pyrophosphatase or phosphodiesterase, AlkP superfamily n=1 Tax=Kytococcus aerolatus TaxID=592308 RepID=A0A212T3Y3_9MICO|nr:nucleotide pyrophosphatase/phosphodiesterase family protein [Kytococcus aerolatus]SNC60580.1 Predicted pyrophosphatase or phosphodiesterase, AlkP superfamily [Kytococcus aerolatus]
MSDVSGLPLLDPHPRRGYAPDGLQGHLGSLAASLGVGVPAPGAAPVRELPPAQGVVSVLLDGLGWSLVERYAGHAPFLRQLLRSGGPEVTARPMVCGYPSTTAASLATHATGLAPGEHGHLGYAVRDPQRDVVFNHLSWKDGPDPLEWQPRPTLFGRLADAGVRVARVGHQRFATTALTRAAQRGGSYLPADDLDAWVSTGLEVVRGARPTEPVVAFLYWPTLDQVGHRTGPGSMEWTAELERIDAALAELVRGLPRGVHLGLTADHGMLAIDASAGFTTADHPHLLTGVAAVAGEPRCRYLYLPREDESPAGRALPADPSRLADVAATWRETITTHAGPDAALVLTREEVVADGWFGPTVAPEHLARIGDVVVAATDPTFTVVDPSADPQSITAMRGWHGGIHPEELLVPDVVVRGA